MTYEMEELNALQTPRQAHRITAEEFMQASSGNLLVHGGIRPQRLALLAEELNRQQGLSVVITAARAEEQALAAAVQSGSLHRRLVICSGDCPNYDPLYGMGRAAMAAFLSEAAAGFGVRDRADLVSYFIALSQLMSAPLSLRTVRSFLLEHGASEFLALAEEQNREDLYEQLLSSAAGARPLRDTVHLLQEAYAPFCGETRLSLETAAEGNWIVVLRPAGPPRLAAQLLAAELEAVREKPVQLLLFDTPLLCRQELRTVTEQYQQQNRLAVFTENLTTWPEPERLQQGMGRQLLLLSGSTNQVDLQRILNGLGSYTRFQATTSETTPMRYLFSVQTSQTRGVTPYERPLVLAREVLGRYEAVLLTPDLGLILARRLELEKGVSRQWNLISGKASMRQLLPLRNRRSLMP